MLQRTREAYRQVQIGFKVEQNKAELIFSMLLVDDASNIILKIHPWNFEIQEFSKLFKLKQGLLNKMDFIFNHT